MRPEQIIAPSDSSVTAIMKLSQGSPRTIVALTHLLVASNNIDPDRQNGPTGLAMALNKLGIRGSSVAKLYDDSCERDNRKFLLLVRGVELGLFPLTRIHELASGKSDVPPLNQQEWAHLDDDVQSRVPTFLERHVPGNLLWM